MIVTFRKCDLVFGFSSGYDFFYQGLVISINNKINTNEKGRVLAESKRK